MTFDQIMEKLTDSSPSDWLYDDGRGLFTLKSDLNVTIRRTGGDVPFAEPWACAFPDKNAYAERYELWYGTSFIKEWHFASVDGHRASLPYPEPPDHKAITREQFEVANIVNQDFRDYFEEYIKRFLIL